MKRTEKFVRGWVYTFLLVFLFLSGSCKYDLVKEPTHNFNEKKSAADYKDYILPPSVVTASNGLSRIVNLEWKKVPNAVQYQIYSAITPYDTFTKISETKADETQISIDEEAGVTKYYCICAVNYYGTVSAKSIVVSGSTLSVPIITEITASDEGTALTVNWWMDNCNENTYESLIDYTITVYSSISSNIPFKPALTTSGEKRSFEIEDLEPKTEYFFTVEAINKETSDSEISNKTSAQTAHRVIPDAPLNVLASKGDSVSTITVSWTLPEQVWYRTNEGTSGFELHPLYFKIFRREESQEYTFLSQEKFTDSYNAGITVSYVDTNVVRGKKYDYYVQSYTDNVPGGKEITAQSSISEETQGWLVSEPAFYIESNYTESEDKLSFTNISFNPKLSFETYGIEYKYVIESKRVDFDPNVQVQEEPTRYPFDSLAAVNEFVDSFENPADSKGYYYYSLYIYPKNGDEYLLVVEASGKYTVTDDVSIIPKIENFTLSEGYKDKFVLSWDYNSDYVYTIHWKDGANGEEQTCEIPSSSFTGKTTGDNVSYEHTANSGDCRIYTLEASAGISKIVRPNNDEDEKLYKTLGTPDIKIVSYEFDKITVEWATVQMASNTYTISAHYEGESEDLIPDENKTKTVEAGANKVSFTITEPAGYNDATKSGKPILFTVTAASSVQSDSTAGLKDVCTLGPALTNTRVSQVDEQQVANAISITWNAVQGAKGYLIKRTCYRKGTTTPNIGEEPGDSDKDTYYYDGNALYINSEPVDSKRAYVTAVDNGFVLTDISQPVEDSLKSYEINQSRLSWGVPYDYFIIPVKADGTGPDFDYESIPHEYGATYGYGLNIKAQKSNDSGRQVVEWDPPYITQDNLPSFYYREAGSSSNIWYKITNVEVDSANNSVSFKPQDPTGAYEYLVAYNKAYDYIDVPVSFLNDQDVGLSAKEDRYTYSDAAFVEKANKGYLLAVKLSAGTGTGYSETVSWGAWDYSKRKIGPDSAQLFIKNYNISAEWKQFKQLDGSLLLDNTIIDKDTLDNTTIKKLDNVTVSLEPTEKIDKNNNLVVTPGYMQVLRDAKHYYKLELKRGEKVCVIGLNDEGKEYIGAYRNITDKELVKCALLNMAYGFYLDAGGNANLSNVDSQLEYEATDSLIFEGIGSASFGSRSPCNIFSSEIGKYKANVSMSGFAPNMLNPGGTKTCVVKITMSSVSTRTRGLDDAYLDKFRTEGFTVSVLPIDDNMPSSYKKDLIMTCTGKDNLIIKIGTETIVQASNETNRRIYFPIQLHDESNWWFKNTTYGWWPNEN